MPFRRKLLIFGLAVAALTAVAVFFAGGALIRRSVSDRVRERLVAEIGLLADTLARDPALLADPARFPERPAGTEPAESTSRAPAESGSREPVGSASGEPVESAHVRDEDVARDASRKSRAPMHAIEHADEFADRVGSALGLRLTLIAPDGRVLGDSAHDGKALLEEDNHATRPEILAALREGLGESVRRSATVRDELFYVARRIDRAGSHVGFVRLAIPVHEIERTSGGYSASLALISFAVLLLVAVLGHTAATRFSRPIEEMSLTAHAIAEGRRDLEVEYESSDEIGRLGSAFNRMTKALSEQISQLSREKRLRDTILGGMREGILVVDSDRHVLLCNDALRSILGLRGQDPTGRPLIEIARNRAVVEGFDAALVRREDFHEVVPEGRDADRAFEIAVTPLTDPAGNQLGAIGVFFDVTRLTALESVRREFIADVSHELRTPLTSIKAFVETLLAGGLEDTNNNRRFLEIIKKHTDRMEALLDDLTDLSLIETGAAALAVERVDISHIARDAAESLRPKAESRDVAIRVEVPPRLVIPADGRRIEQVLLNLVDNAIKFNRPGGTVTIRAGLQTDSESGFAGEGRLAAPGVDSGLRSSQRIVRVEVEDTGVGIPPDALERIFHRFYRVDRARSREMGGTGLGLSIVKHLVRLHEGEVRAESQPGRGSRFIVDLPSDLPG